MRGEGWRDGRGRDRMRYTLPDLFRYEMTTGQPLQPAVTHDDWHWAKDRLAVIHACRPIVRGAKMATS